MAKKASRDDVRGKSALVVVLGIHGGGVATAKWLLAHGAKVTVTDLRTEDVLARSLAQFTPSEKRRTRFVLGGQNEEDFRTHDIVVLGPGVPRESPYLAAALSASRDIQNDASLFFRHIINPTIAVTGTRGKTTTTHWIASLLSKKYGKITPTGNNPDHPFLHELLSLERSGDTKRPVVVEASSWQLEYLSRGGKAPRVAVITNLFPDHLNRYGGNMEEYARAKAEIFRLQNSTDVLILNAKNTWTDFFLSLRPNARVYYFSLRPLLKKQNGIFLRGDFIVCRDNGTEKVLARMANIPGLFGTHNTENLLAAILAAHLADPSLRFSASMIRLLKAPHMRQEIVYKKGRLSVVNDSCATSPDGTIVAIRRFAKKAEDAPRVILITGGTDKQLDMEKLAREIKKHIAPQNLILLDGSATAKLNDELARLNYGKKSSPVLCETFDACVRFALARAKSEKGEAIVLFSPGAASFEKFLHEFDRGEQFNALIRKNLR